MIVLIAKSRDFSIPTFSDIARLTCSKGRCMRTIMTLEETADYLRKSRNLLPLDLPRVYTLSHRGLRHVDIFAIFTE